MKEYSFFRSRILSSAVLAAFVLTLVPLTTHAQTRLTHYSDVQAGVWYEEAAKSLLESGALDDSEATLRPNDIANRAEVAKLLVQVHSTDPVYPATASFRDVSRTAWYFPYIETSAQKGWLRGDANCYGSTPSTCTARPSASVNRAEMAIMLQRALNLPVLNLAPKFNDVEANAWYANAIQAAADHCILMGDGGTGNVRPGAHMNRAEMVTMFHRAWQHMRYGQDCAEPRGEISAVSATSNTTLQVTFNTDLSPNEIGNASRYELELTNGTDVDISAVSVVNARTVRLHLNESLQSNSNYRLTVTNMRTQANAVFTDTSTFSSGTVSVAAAIDSVSLSGSNVLHVTFNSDLVASRADDASRYEVMRTSGGGEIDVTQATVINARVVELRLASNLSASTSYKLNVSDLLTNANNEFDSTKTFVTSSVNAMIEETTVTASNRIRVKFNTTVDANRAEEEERYRVTTTGQSHAVISAILVANDMVELTVNPALSNQTLYTVEVLGMETASDLIFSDTTTVLYSTTNISFDTALSGGQEVPSVSTSASGTGTFVLTSNGLQYDITLTNLSGSAITGAHFHRGSVGVNGPVLESINFSNGRATGTWTNLTAEERNDLLNEDVYVNVHSNTYPDGEIRGQVEVQ